MHGIISRCIVHIADAQTSIEKTCMVDGTWCTGKIQFPWATYTPQDHRPGQRAKSICKEVLPVPCPGILVALASFSSGPESWPTPPGRCRRARPFSSCGMAFYDSLLKVLLIISTSFGPYSALIQAGSPISTSSNPLVGACCATCCSRRVVGPYRGRHGRR